MADPTTKSIIVGTDGAEAFAAWSRFEEFPRFMEHLKRVTRIDERRSHWVAEGPMGADVEWDAETTRFEPPKRIGWHSLADSRVKTSGQVTFNQLSPRQTEITVTLKYVVPAGSLGERMARLLKDPEAALEESLRQFKARIEQRVPTTP